MFKLCKQGFLPHKFLKLNNSNTKLLCPTCIFSKQKRSQWRTSNTSSSIRKDIDNKPGAKVSIDQFVSKHPGLVPRISGKHTSARIIGGTIYVDHYTNFLFCHFHTYLNTEQTLDSKIAFENLHIQMEFISIHIMQIMEDFQNKLSKSQSTIQIRQFHIVQLMHIIKMA